MDVKNNSYKIAATRFKKISLVCSIVVALIGFFVLIGWAGNITVLKSIFPHRISMKANAAICFIMAGAILVLVNHEKRVTIIKWPVAIFALLIFLTGAITLLEYIFEFNTGFDEFFFKDTGSDFPEFPPGRQSIFSADYFMLFGFCYFPGIYKRIKISLFQILHLASGILVLASALSYVLGHYIVAGIPINSIFVIHSTIAFLLLIMAVLFSRPESGYMKLVSSNTIGGKVIRKTLPVFLFAFVIIGWLGLRGEETGLYNKEFNVSIFIILMILINGFILFTGATSLANSEVILKQTDEKLRYLNESLELAEQQAGLGNWEFDVESQVRTWSKQMFRLFNQLPSEKAPSNEEFLELIHPEDRQAFMKAVLQMDEDIDMEKNIFRTNSPKIPLKYLLPRWDVVKDAKGNPIKYFGTLQDITERIAAREALKQREELFSKAFHSKVFGLAIVNKERRVMDINETLASLIEYKREDFIGKTSVEIGLTQPDYIKKRDELLQLLLQKGRINNYELELKTRYGKSLSLLLSVEPMRLNDKSHWLIYLVDITEKKKTEEEIKNAVEQIKINNEQLHQLTAHLQNIREEERSRIGREIHDQLGQHLTVLKLEVSRLQMKKTLEKNSENDIVEILNQFDNCISIARKISYDLRPGIIDDLGIIDAIEWQMAEFEKRTKIKTEFRVNVTELILQPAYAIGLFRIFQESLTNIVRHSKAKYVIGTLNVINNFIELTITDDGRGFDKATIDNKKNLGILGMKERTLLMNGSYEIDSTPGKGTEVKVTIPLP